MYLLFVFTARAHFTARRYDEAADWARQAIQRRPNAPEPRLLLSVSLAYLGETEDARAELEALETLRPGYSNPAAWTRTYKQSADNEHFLEGLRKAGSKG